MLNYQASDELPATFLACPKKGGAKEGHPATILIRPARSSSVHFRNSGFALRHSQSAGSLKCLTLGLGRMTGMFAWGGINGFKSFYPKLEDPKMNFVNVPRSKLRGM